MSTERFVCVGSPAAGPWSDFNWSKVVSTQDGVESLLASLDGRRRSYLVVSEARGWTWLLRGLSKTQSPRRWRCSILGVVDFEHAWSSESLLEARFDRCVRPPPQMLPAEELLEVLKRDDRQDFCVGGAVNLAHNTIVVVRGNVELLSVPMSMFQSSADGPKPDFDRFEVTDYGQTLRFGDYEAAFDAVLYEVDAEYRRRLNKARRIEDRSFGAALRRLRAQRGIGRDEFEGVSAKTIARIERGEGSKPRAATIEKIAGRLGVSADEIQTW